jgi:site-specific DNA-methyltransferase (adenine-specific)/modification methylase
MKKLPDGCIDAVITDPPYGINLNADYSRFKGWNGPGRKFRNVIGDDKPFDPKPFLRFPKIILFGANHYASRLPDSGGWIVWDKRGNGLPSNNWFSDCELAWTNLSGHVTRFSYMWHGVARWSKEDAQHPTQKPVDLMIYCIKMAGLPETILDPFLGSGTTAVAAKKLGRHFLGFEIDEDYCEIAGKRIKRAEHGDYSLRKDKTGMLDLF